VASLRPGARVEGPPDADVGALGQKYDPPIWVRVADEARAARAIEAARLEPGQVPRTRRVEPLPATWRQGVASAPPSALDDYVPGSLPPQVAAAVERELKREAASYPPALRLGAAAVPSSRPAVTPPPAPVPARERSRPPGAAPATQRSLDALPPPAAVPRPASGMAPPAPPVPAPPAGSATYAGAAEACTRAAVEAALARNPGNKSAAARELGLTREGLRGVLQRYGLAAPIDPVLRAVRARAGAVGAKARWG
jgi:hypothetical protein